MIIIVKNLSKNTHYNDIISLIEPVVKKRFFRKGGEIESVQMLIVRDKKNNKIEYHGLVRISPDKMAQQVIEHLNNFAFQGKTLEARQYLPRSWRNDRRQTPLHPNFVLVCQRKKNRRRPTLESKIVNPDLTGWFTHYFFN